MTLDEYKKQVEAKKRANQEKLPQFKTRAAGEGEDPKEWQKPEHVYRKKTDGDESDEGEDEEEGSGVEGKFRFEINKSKTFLFIENESGEEVEEEHLSGKKKLISIPLRFKPIDIPRGSRGGQRRFRGNHSDQPRCKYLLNHFQK
jgi:hypothetical protein